MSDITIRPATLEDRAFIRSVSERTWPSTYGHIISQEQIDFMFDWMYSDASLAEQFEKGMITCLLLCKISHDSQI